MNEIDHRPMIQTGRKFEEAVKFWTPRNECVRELVKARRALYKSGINSALAVPVTLALRRELFELEVMRSDGRWVEASSQ